MKKYWIDLYERAVGSFAGAVIAAWGGEAVNLLQVDWLSALGLGAGAAVFSILKSLAAKTVGDSNSASLTRSV